MAAVTYKETHIPIATVSYVSKGPLVVYDTATFLGKEMTKRRCISIKEVIAIENTRLQVEKENLALNGNTNA